MAFNIIYLFSLYCDVVLCVMYALCRCLQFVQCLEFNLNFWHWLTGAKIKSISEFKGWLFCNVFFVILMAAASWLPACEMWVWSGLGRALKKVISKCGQQRREVRCHGKYDYSITGPCYPHCAKHGRFCSPPELVAWCPLKIMKKLIFKELPPWPKRVTTALDAAHLWPEFGGWDFNAAATSQIQSRLLKP